MAIQQKNDYILDMVEALIRNFTRRMLHKEDDDNPAYSATLSEDDMILLFLKKLINEKRYNEAEDALFDFAEKHPDSEHLEAIGEWFYDQLEKQKDEDLLNNGFSREEIEQGLKDFKDFKDSISK